MPMFFGVSSLKTQGFGWLSHLQVDIEDEITASKELYFSTASFMGT
jgi:hypothetical protein